MKKRHHFKSALSDVHRDEVAKDLQATLIDLIDLALQTKQLHWVVVGPRFQSLHERLDVLTATFREMSDAAAERCTAVGVAPNGTATQVATKSSLLNLPEGFIADAEVAELITTRVLDTARAIRTRISRVSQFDAVTEDLLLGFVMKLEEQAWMLQAQTMTPDRSVPAARATVAQA